MNPFELFQSSEIYKLAILYFSRSRGLAIVGRHAPGGNVEVIQISGEVDPHTGNFTALDYPSPERGEHLPVISKRDFENLVRFIEAKIDDQTRMSIIEPDLINSAMSKACCKESPSQFIQ
ncbi:MAG: hypothetical protein HY913_14340 [Desulfomonile tiedjei]|nr:hypothetical protein [Desulfomonile tiedjei]